MVTLALFAGLIGGLCFWVEEQKFLTVVKFDRGGFQLFFSPPGRLVFAPPPGSPGYWHTAPSWTAGCLEYWCCPPCGTQTKVELGNIHTNHSSVKNPGPQCLQYYNLFFFLVLSIIPIITPQSSDLLKAGNASINGKSLTGQFDDQACYDYFGVFITCTILQFIVEIAKIDIWMMKVALL